MKELFNIPETKSPRLRWMERHHLTTKLDESASSEKRWTAYHGMDRIAYGASQDDALVAAANSLNIKLWNEL